MTCLTSNAKLVNAQTVAKPSIPQFTLSFQYEFASPAVQRSTGEYLANAYITVRVRNQPFTPYLNASKYPIQLYYDVRWKYYFTSYWEGSLFALYIFPIQDLGSGYTDIHIGFNGSAYLPLHDTDTSINIPFGLNGLEDIQVEAGIGYVTRNFSFPNAASFDDSYFVGQTSGWSNTQTINISIAPSPTPTPTAPIPELSRFAIVPLLLSVFSVALVVRHRKATKLNQQTFSRMSSLR